MRLCVVMLAVVATCCGRSVPPLAHTYSSPRDLAAAALNAVERRDVEALTALALSEEEFREHVWPELPAARPERNMPLSYVWGDLHQKSRVSLAQTIEAKGGRRYELIDVRFDGGITRYSTFSVHRQTVLLVRDHEGIQQPVSIFGSAMEKDGRWKVFSYVVD